MSSTTIPADAFKLSQEGEAIVLEFGTVEADGVRGTDRLRLDRVTAQRLAVTLEEQLRPHAARLRAARAQRLPPTAAASAMATAPAPPLPAPDRAAEAGATLLRMVGDLGVSHHTERSLRMRPQSLQADRFLVTMNIADLTDPVRDVLAIADRLGLPPRLHEEARTAFDGARCVHLGFEGSPAGALCKLYLEVAVSADPARADRVLLHRAFKWDMTTSDAVTSLYWWHPGLDAAQIAARLDAMLGAGSEPAGIAAAVLARAGATPMQYLEVEETETNRRSFDLNLYPARLAVRDIHDPLLRMRAHFGVRPGQFQALYDQIKSLALGHLAGGRHRDGAEFFNVYYGATGAPR